MADIFVAPKNRGEIQEAPAPHNNALNLSGSEKVNMLSTFSKNPKGISFQTQKSGEKILIFLRSHLITNFSWIFIAIFLALVPLVIAITLPRLNMNISSSPDVNHFITIYVLLYYLIVFSYIFLNFLHWFYNVFMVTSQQVVDIDYSDVVVHHIAVTSLSQVQDTKYTQSGFIPTFFDYGDIFVQTAGTHPNFQEPSVPRPREATYLIGDIIGKNLMRGHKFPERDPA